MVKSSKDLTGTIIAQKYKLLKLLGEGGMGTVYQAQDILVNRTVALKVLKAETDNEEAVRRFQREATIAARIDSPHCVGLLDFGVAEDQPFLVMPYVDGSSLSQVIDEGPLPPPVAIDIFLQICAGLEAAHAKGVVHRDIKPSNVILIANNSGYSVKILDFGIAKLREPDATAARTMTGTGEFLGSPKYMSPEQCEGLPADQRSDIYSLGILMYESLTGAPPFKEENVFAIIEKHRNIAPPQIYITGVSKSGAEKIRLIIFRCLEKRPADRYGKVTDLAADLKKAKSELNRQGFSWPRFGTGSPRKLLRINSLAFSLIAILFVSSVLVAVLFLKGVLSEPPLDSRKIDLGLPHATLVSETEKHEKEQYFDFTIATAKRIAGDSSDAYMKLCEEAGDFFKSQNDPNNAMRYYGPAAVCLQKMGLSKSIETAELLIKQAECCVPLGYKQAFQRDRLAEALDILRPKLEDSFIAVEYMRASSLTGQVDLDLYLHEKGYAWKLKWIEFAFQSTIDVYDKYVASNQVARPLILIPALTEAGDYFFKRAETATDADAVEKSIKNCRKAFKAARQQCEGNELYATTSVSCWNRTAMVEMLSHNYADAISDLQIAYRLLEKSGNSPVRARESILYNLSDCYLSTRDYANWFKTRTEILRTERAF